MNKIPYFPGRVFSDFLFYFPNKDTVDQGLIIRWMVVSVSILKTNIYYYWVYIFQQMELL